MSRRPLDPTNPQELLDLCANLHDRSATAIQIKVNNYLKQKCEAQLVFLVQLLKEREEAVVQVIGEKVLVKEMRFPVTNNCLHAVMQRRTSLSADACDLDPDLHASLRYVINPLPEQFLVVPVWHPSEDSICIVACLVDYAQYENSEEYCSHIVSECFRYCIGTVLNTLAYEGEMRLKVQCQNLLIIARKLVSHLGEFTDLCREIMLEAKKLTLAERCSIFLLDEESQELVAKVFDGIPAAEEVRIAKDKGIAGHVMSTGQVLNIRNAYEHPLFYKGVDEATGFKTRCILSFPIRDESGIIGVAQLCNKIGGLYFDVYDEEAAVAFSIYCGISIMHSLVYKKIQDAQARSKLANEMMIYHMKVSQEDVGRVLDCEKAHEMMPDIGLFHFSPRKIEESESVCYCLRMFDDLGLVQQWQLKKDILTRFLLFVRKGYRDAPYHNWYHAFSVFHFSYLAIKNLRLVERGYISSLEALALMVSCLCHDLDHRGTTNSFQMQSGTELASLYSSEGSVMERHHLAQALCILNTDGCNIFDGLTSEQYSHCLDLIRDLILATDLAHHIRLVQDQEKMAEEGFDFKNSRHRQLILFLLMTCSDLSDQTKDWKVSRTIADLVYQEFFSQGDLEKAMGNAPLEMMDREKARIPDLQIQFLSHIVCPVFKILAQLFPEADCLLQSTLRNRHCWEQASALFARKWESGYSSLDILRDLELESFTDSVPH